MSEPVHISSTQNRQIQQAHRLRKPAHRREQGHTLIEGEPEIRRALAQRVPFHAVYVCPEKIRGRTARRLAAQLLELARRSDCRYYTVAPHVFERLAMRGGTECIVVEARPVRLSLRDLEDRSGGPLVVLEDADRPGNVGAALRTCHAAGAAGLILARTSGHGTDLQNPAVIRASLGTVFDVPAAQEDTEKTVKWLQHRRKPIVAVTPEGEGLYEGAPLPEQPVLVFGSETRGLSPAWTQVAHRFISIPMVGEAVDSLNLSVSVAVVLYENLRQQRATG